MKAEYVNPFLEAANLVFNDLLKEKLIRGKTHITSEFSPNKIHDIMILIEITGSIKGGVIYAFQEYTAKKIVEKLIGSNDEKTFESDYKDILGEIGNMITGNALNIFLKRNQFVDITVPEIIDLRKRKFNPLKRMTVRLNMYSNIGMLEINVSVRDENYRF